jgi:Ala-tRNA(Pro) deacylase
MNIKAYLNSRRVDFKVYQHDETADAQHLAQSLHVPGGNIAKTVLLRANGGFKYLLLVLPAAEQLDLSKVSKAIGGAQIHLATESEIANCCPDCELGILPPFGSRINAETLVDESLSKHADLFFQGDSHCEAIRLRYQDFCRIEHPMVVSVIQTHEPVPATA